MLTEITDSNFEENVRKASSPFVLIFSSPWCGVCKKVVPRVESVSEKCKKSQFGKIDITANTQKPSEFQVLSIPTIIIFQDGKEKERTVGDISEQQLVQKIEEAL